MSIETAVERIGNLANLTEMKRAKAELENSDLESDYAVARNAFRQALSILEEEADQ